MDINLIREPRQALRGPERLDANYAQLRDSIREKGVITPILVRPVGDHYEIVDGTQRYNLSRETGKQTIPAEIRECSETEALELQIILNLHRVETSPLQYAEQLRLMMALNPSLTAPKLAVKLDKSPTWVYQILGLTRLHPVVSSLVDRGLICIANAAALSKIPQDEQVNYLEQAKEQSPREFAPRITDIARELRNGRVTPTPYQYRHTDRFQKMSTIKEEIASLLVARRLGANLKAWKLALEWVLHRDPISREAAEAKERQLMARDAERQRDLENEKRAREEGL